MGSKEMGSKWGQNGVRLENGVKMGSGLKMGSKWGQAWDMGI